MKKILLAFSIFVIGTGISAQEKNPNEVVLCGNQIGVMQKGYTEAEVRKLIAEAVKAANARADVRHQADAETIKSLTDALAASVNRDKIK